MIHITKQAVEAAFELALYTRPPARFKGKKPIAEKGRNFSTKRSQFLLTDMLESQWTTAHSVGCVVIFFVSSSKSKLKIGITISFH